MKSSTQRGSALLLAVIIIALVGAVGFGLIRITILQGQTQGSASLSLQAYNAAETGLEYALLQYRVDKDVEIPSGSAQSTKTLNSNQSFVVSMTHMATQLGSDSCLAVVAATYSTITACDTDPLNPLTKMNPDDALTFQTTAAANHLLVRAVAADNTGTYVASQAGATRGILQVAYFLRNADGTENLLKQDTYKLGEAAGQSLASTVGGLELAAPASFNKVTVTYLHSGDSSLALMVVLKNASGTVLPFDTGITTIAAVGKSGAVKRRMAARIDRRTDRVLSVLDFALHSGAASTP